MIKGAEKVVFEEEHISAEKAKAVVAKLMKLAKKDKEEIEEVAQQVAATALVKQLVELPSASKQVKAAISAITPHQAMKAVSGLLPQGRPGAKHKYPAPTKGEIAAYKFYGRAKTYSTRGQGAPKKDVDPDSFNNNEKAVLKALKGSTIGPTHMLQIATGAFGDTAPTPTDDCKSYVKVKNALRRLVVGGYVKKVGKGLYDIAD